MAEYGGASGWHTENGMTLTLRRVLIIVASLNLAYFGIEFSVALAIGSVSLFADSIDFLEDASINLLIAVALGWSARLAQECRNDPNRIRRSARCQHRGVDWAEASGFRQ